MPYAKRTGGKRHRHDPAAAGIFIQGGSNAFPATAPTDSDWWHKQQEQRGANSFHITLPLRNRKGEDIPEEISAAFSTQWEHPFPTFNLALAYAKTLRVSHPILADCHIYACTDCVMESRCTGRFAVQLVSPSRIYRPNGMGPCPVRAHAAIREAIAA